MEHSPQETKRNSACDLRHHWREITGVFLKLGAMSYGGPAIMGMMQAEVQEKRGWLSKDSFIEGLGLVNMLPGPGATLLGIFLGFTRGGWWGGLLAGLCFVLPALCIMLGLTWAYTAYGALPAMRGVFYGLAPVVVGIFAVAVWRRVVAEPGVTNAEVVGDLVDHCHPHLPHHVGLGRAPGQDREPEDADPVRHHHSAVPGVALGERHSVVQAQK